MYLLVLHHCEQVIAHQIHLLPVFPQPLHLLQAARGVVDLSIFSEDGSLPHHFFDVLVDGEEAVEDLSGPFGVETAFVFDGGQVFPGFLLYFLQPPFDPCCLHLQIPMHSFMYTF